MHTNIGKYSYIGYDSTVVYTDIGRYCSIAAGCFIGGGGHPLGHVSTSPVFHSGKNIFGANLARHEFEPYQRTVIGNDVWIGHDVKIKGGVTIADGAVLGMGAVVTHDVGPYEIWAGNPARLIRKRFDDLVIEKLLNSKWWDLDEQELVKFADYLNAPVLFLEKAFPAP